MVGYDKKDPLTAHQKFIAGSVSGMVTRFVANPIDVLKVRAQVQKQTPSSINKRWFALSRKIIKAEGISALWQGHTIGQV